MSIKKKIVFGFLISAVVIAVLAIFEYLNFVEIRQEIQNLEFTDTIRSKSLQLRRHEKNFFLLSPHESSQEWKEIQRYLNELNDMLNENKRFSGDRSRVVGAQHPVPLLRSVVEKYRETFESIKNNIDQISENLRAILGSPENRGSSGVVGSPKNQRIFLGSSAVAYERIKSLMLAAFREQPLLVSEFLIKEELLLPDDPVAQKLRRLDSDILILRKYGEEIVSISRELDRLARQRVEETISFSKTALVIFFPVFLFTGLWFLLVVTGSIVNRLGLLTSMVETVGKGEFRRLHSEAVDETSDEVGLLIKKFNEMEEELSIREEELKRKNEELLQSKKLAALGTLAAGVAHELNNPLNNIYISAQVLKKEGENLPSSLLETVDDIMNQSMRVKHIVSDLLEFARGRDPVKRKIDLREVILGSYKFVSTTRNTEGIDFSFQATDAPLIAMADPEQMERVFINLFNNAIDAMDGKGELNVTVGAQRTIPLQVIIKVSDTGKGISSEIIEKIFEPFYSTKQRGTGLGLAIVYNIIQKHDGRIFVESEEGRGTIVTIILEGYNELPDSRS